MGNAINSETAFDIALAYVTPGGIRFADLLFEEEEGPDGEFWFCLWDRTRRYLKLAVDAQGNATLFGWDEDHERWDTDFAEVMASRAANGLGF